MRDPGHNSAVILAHVIAFSTMNVRPALESDVDAIREIYNYYVVNSVVTFDTEPQPHEARLSWLREHNKNELPVLVAEAEGTAAGWASLSYYHARCAYRTTVEFSVYVHHEQHRKGVAKALMSELMRMAAERDFHCVVGLICSENTSSLEMVRSMGFETVGELREVGRKFDRWLNVTFVQRFVQ
jgi:L-amino acid N-acyltransferase YncA